MPTVFLEIVLRASDFTEAGFEARDEIEDPIADALEEHGLGEVTGGGGGMGWLNIDVEVGGEAHFQDALGLIRRTLVAMRVPRSTQIIRHQPTKIVFDVYD